MLYQKIKAIADSKGISIRQIEIGTGMKTCSIYHWDKIKPSYDKVVSVANFLGVTVEELVGKVGV